MVKVKKYTVGKNMVTKAGIPKVNKPKIVEIQAGVGTKIQPVKQPQVKPNVNLKKRKVK